MGRFTRIAILALALAAVFGGLFGGSNQAEAANGYEQWTAGWSDGCLYYWDGFVYTIAACPSQIGGLDIYVPNTGQWSYILTMGSLSDGGTWTYYDGVYYYDTATGYIDGVYQTEFTVGGTNYDLTSNVVANQFLIDARLGSNDATLAQYCYEIYMDICYR